MCIVKKVRKPETFNAAHLKGVKLNGFSFEDLFVHTFSKQFKYYNNIVAPTTENQSSTLHHREQWKCKGNHLQFQILVQFDVPLSNNILSICFENAQVDRSNWLDDWFMFAFCEIWNIFGCKNLSLSNWVVSSSMIQDQDEN